MKFVHILLIAAVASCLISCAAPARLDEAGRTIAGTVTYRARIALPSGSEVVVEARDGNGKVLAEKTLPTQGRQPPFQYTLQIPADATATLRAGIRVGGQPRWASEPIEIAAGSEPNDGIEIVVQPVRPVGFASRLRCGETDVTLGAEGQNAVLEVGGERFELAPVQSASGRRYQASGDPQTFVQLEGSRSQVSIRGKMLPECSDLKTPPENGTAIPDTYGSSGARRATDERVDDEQAGMAGIGDLPSSYEGELSCQGCEAIRYQLNLLPDHRYVLRTSYRGTGHQSDSSGIWRFLADGTELLLAAGDREGQCLFEIDAGSGLRWLNKGMESASLLKRVDAFQAIQPRTTQATDGLENVHWRLTELEDVPVVGKPPQPGELPQPAPWLTLNSLEHSVIGQSGCNLMTGHYLIDDSRLEFVKIATTRRACMPGITIEQGFLAVLERVKGWRLDGLKLDMLDANGQPVAHFRKEAPKPSMPRPSRRKTN